MEDSGHRFRPTIQPFLVIHARGLRVGRCVQSLPNRLGQNPGKQALSADDFGVVGEYSLRDALESDLGLRHDEGKIEIGGGEMRGSNGG